MAETKYKPHAIILKSRGLIARSATDQTPEHTYLNMTGVLEREEESLSTRFGSTIINKSGGSPFSNFPLPFAPVTLSRIRSLSGLPYRYAGLTDGSLWRRAGDTNGTYLSIATGLSGQPFTTIVTTCIGSSQPFNFIFDRVKMLKDTGTGTPTQIGIFPPTQPVTATQYAPQISVIDSFQSSSGYGPSSMTLVSITTAFTVSGTGGTPILSGNYEQYVDATSSYRPVPDGMIATSVTLADGAIRLKFNTVTVNTQYDIVALNNAYVAADSFTFKQVTFSIAASTTGYIGKTVALDLSKYQGDDLIVIVLQCSSPQSVQEIRVEFDVNSSGYAGSYYYKSIIPVSYQGSISLPQTNDPTSAMVNEVFNRALGVTNLQQLGNQQLLPVDDPNLPGVQSSQMSSGAGSWSVIYLPKGQFQPVGNAGQSGNDWSKITGWRVQVTTNSQGSSNVSFNGLYIQGSPTITGTGTLAGASSYGGVGYDFRYTYFDASTITESNGCRSAYFSVTPTNPGGSSTLIVLRQAIDLLLQYSADPQVTHIRVYARGGVFGTNWFYADQIPNVTGTGIVHYKYILPDSALEQGNVLSLTNDVPVTSTLPNPIDTTLINAPTPIVVTGIPNTPVLQTINVANASAVFVPYQIVDIGTPQNLEQVYVVAGGTGTFTAYIQLPHAIGERVQVFATPGQPLFLAALAYGQVYMAGDFNNPHYLYYTPVGRPQYCPPQNYIPVGSPTDPISAVINHRGTLFVRTYSTWYQIFPGNPPYAQSTGSKHGSPASFDWCITESEIWYQAFDGIRTFRGADGKYESLIIEWLFRNNPLTPVPLVDTTKLSQVIGAFKNNTAVFSYIGQDGNRHRLLWSTQYHRWRNDDVPATAMLVETDTNTLVYAVPYPNQTGWAIVQSDTTKDYDDGGWVGGVLAQQPIPMNLQLPFIDIGAPNNQKNFNILTVDAAPNGQSIGLQLLFDDDNGSVPSITLPNFTGTIRQKFQFIINGGLGQQAYKISPKFTANVVAAPIIYQADIEAAILAAQTDSWDSYWIKFNSDESKLLKQGFFDYTTSDGNSILVRLFADGNTIPYYTFTLPPNTARSEVPTRRRFPPIKLRMFRLVMTSVVASGSFQIWNPVQCDTKLICVGKGYERKELVEGVSA